MQVLQVEGEYVRLSIPSCSFSKVEPAVITGDCQAVAELLTSAEGLAAVDKSMRTTLACTAADRGHSACLRIIFKKGINLDGSVSRAAAAAGNLPCLSLAYSHKDCWTWRTMKEAASKGHANCLLYLLNHGCSFGTEEHGLSKMYKSLVLDAAIRGGHSACVEVLVAHPLPLEPCLYKAGICHGEPVGVMQLRCLQHLLDKAISIHPGTLISAARRGDLETLRFLHRRGAPLWRVAYDEESEDHPSKCYVRLKPVDLYPFDRGFLLYYGVITIPQIPDADADADAYSMWAALRYGWVMGAPVTPLMEEAFMAQRAGTRTTFLCFHNATRLSKGEGTCKQRAAWAVMGCVPVNLVEKIIMHANFEIPETMCRSFQNECNERVRISRKPFWWYRNNGPIRLYAAPGVDNGDYNFW